MKKSPRSKLMFSLYFAPDTAIAFAADSRNIEQNTQKFLQAPEQGGGKPIEQLTSVDARAVLTGAQQGAKLPPADVSEKTSARTANPWI